MAELLFLSFLKALSPNTIAAMSFSDAQQDVVESVEAVFTDTVGHRIEGALMEHTLQLWRDFASEVDVSRTRKPETWAAALLYASVRLWLGAISQEEAADWFEVSSVTVSTKYRKIAETLNLVVLDERYLPEGKRAAVRKKYRSVPNDLPLVEAPVDPWRFMFVPPEDLDSVNFPMFADVEDHVLDGWDAVHRGDFEEAEAHFQAALDNDPWCVDAYNGLAAIAEERGDVEAAHEHYQEAYERAREMLDSESADAYWWWGDLDTRPYMRARAGLASTYWAREQYRDAIDEYEALLDLNPNDNQGVRFIVGPLYQLAGDLEGALAYYRAYDEAYPEDICDPHHTFSWGLALYRADLARRAISKWYEGFFQNIYIAPLLLDNPLPPKGIRHFSNLEYPSYARSYPNTYQPLWADATNAKHLLSHLWNDLEVEEARSRWIQLGQRMQVIAEGTERDDETQQRWERLAEKRYAIADAPLPKAVRKRVAKKDKKRA